MDGTQIKIASKVTPFDSRFLFGVRCTIALIWLYEGLWLKVIAQDAHELSIVRQFSNTPDGARLLMLGIGCAETLLALGVLSGWYWRALSWFQITILPVMNLVGIFFGGGTIAKPAGLIIHNLPLFLCMALIALYGPGSWISGANLRHEK